MAFLPKMQRKELFCIEDLSYLSRLLSSGLSLNECFDLLKTRKNEKIFSAIRQKLDEGEPIEKAAACYLPSKIRSYIIPLLSSLSFSEALHLSLNFYTKNEEDKKRLWSSLAYPLILLFISVSSLYLFDLYGIDSIFALISSFESNIKLYENFRVLFRVMVNVFYYGVLLTFLLIVLCMRPQRIVLLYLFVSKHFPNSFVSIYNSEEFMSLFLICIKAGYSTRESLHILKAMKNKPLISFLAFHMDESLMEGETMKEAAGKDYYDSALSRFIKIATHANDFSKIIESYISLAKEKIARRMKGYTLAIQLITYAFIGAVIIFIYQILFMPMRAISIF